MDCPKPLVLQCFLTATPLIKGVKVTPLIKGVWVVRVVLISLILLLVGGGLKVFQGSFVSDLFSRVLFSFLAPLLATPLPPLFWAPFRPVLPLEKCSVLQSKGHSTDLEEGQFQKRKPQNSSLTL